MKVLRSHGPTQVPTSTVLCSLLVAALGGATLGVLNAHGSGPTLAAPMQLLFVCTAFALTLVILTDFGEDVLRWMAGRYWVRLLIWVAFGMALGSAMWELLQLEFASQFRGFKG